MCSPSNFSLPYRAWEYMKWSLDIYTNSPHMKHMNKWERKCMLNLGINEFYYISQLVRTRVVIVVRTGKGTRISEQLSDDRLV